MKKYINLVPRLFLPLLALFIVLTVFFKIVEDINIDLLDLLITLSGAALGMLVAFLSLTLYYDVFKKKRIKIFITDNFNQEFSKKLALDLEEYGFNVLYQNKIVLVGDVIEDKITEAISTTDFFIPIISEEAINSEYFNEELDLALSFDKKVLPVVIENSQLPKMLNGIQFADFTSDYKIGIKSLVKAIEASGKTKEK